MGKPVEAVEAAEAARGAEAKPSSHMMDRKGRPGTVEADAADADGMAADEGGQWCDLLAADDRGHARLPMSCHQWEQVSRMLALLSRLPTEWLPLEQLHWMLPAVLLLAQLANADADADARAGAHPDAHAANADPADATDTDGAPADTGAGAEAALLAALRLAAMLAATSPTRTHALMISAGGGRAFRRVLRWAVRLPAIRATHAHKAVPAAGGIADAATSCAQLVGALTTAALVAPPRADGQLFAGGWTRWLDGITLTAPVPPTGAFAATASAEAMVTRLSAMRALTAHLQAVARALPPPPRHPSRAAPSSWAVDTAGTRAARTASTASVDGMRTRCAATAAWLQTLRAALLPDVHSPHGAQEDALWPWALLTASAEEMVADGMGLDADMRAVPGGNSAGGEAATCLCTLLELISAWLRCYHGVIAQDEAWSDTLAPPPRVRSAILCALRLLAPPPSASASTCSSALIGPHTPSSALEMALTPLRTASAAEGRCHRGGATPQLQAAALSQLQAAALSLLDSLSEHPSILFLALPIGDQRATVAVLVHRLEPHAATVRLSPSGRVLAADAHSPLGMLRRLLHATAEAARDGALLAWAVQVLLDDLRRAPREARAAHGQPCAALLVLAVVCAASATPHVALITMRQAEIIGVLVGAATMPSGGGDAKALAAAEAERRCATLALTALATNDQVRLRISDGAPLLLAAGTFATWLDLRCAPLPAELPSNAAFNAAYFLLVALLRQRSRLVHGAVPLLIAVVRGLLLAAAHGTRAVAAAGAADPAPRVEAPISLEAVRNLRRLYELLAAHKKVLVRHGAYLLADLVGVCRERPLPPAAQRELLPGIHALLGMCTEVEVQAVHAASDPARQRVLKDLLESYEQSFKYKGKA